MLFGYLSAVANISFIMDSCWLEIKEDQVLSSASWPDVGVDNTHTIWIDCTEHLAVLFAV